MKHNDIMSIMEDLAKPDNSDMRLIVEEVGICNDEFSSYESTGVSAMAICITKNVADKLAELSETIRKADGPLWRIELDDEKIGGLAVSALDGIGDYTQHDRSDVDQEIMSSLSADKVEHGYSSIIIDSMDVLFKHECEGQWVAVLIKADSLWQRASADDRHVLKP